MSGADPVLGPLLDQTSRAARALAAAKPAQRKGGRGTERGLPIFVEAVDHRQELIGFLRRWTVRASAILGWHLPPVPLARHGYLPCPYCLAGALWVDRGGADEDRPQPWAVVCRNPACRDDRGDPYRWQVELDPDGRIVGEVARLGQLIAETLEDLAARAPDDAETAFLGAVGGLLDEAGLIPPDQPIPAALEASA